MASTPPPLPHGHGHPACHLGPRPRPRRTGTTRCSRPGCAASDSPRGCGHGRLRPVPPAGPPVLGKPFGPRTRVEDRLYDARSPDGRTTHRLMDASYLVEARAGSLAPDDRRQHLRAARRRLERAAEARLPRPHHCRLDGAAAGQALPAAWIADVTARARAQGKSLLTLSHYPVSTRSRIAPTSTARFSARPRHAAAAPPRRWPRRWRGGGCAPISSATSIARAPPAATPRQARSSTWPCPRSWPFHPASSWPRPPPTAPRVENRGARPGPLDPAARCSPSTAPKATRRPRCGRRPIIRASCWPRPAAAARWRDVRATGPRPSRLPCPPRPRSTLPHGWKARRALPPTPPAPPWPKPARPGRACCRPGAGRLSLTDLAADWYVLREARSPRARGPCPRPPRRLPPPRRPRLWRPGPGGHAGPGLLRTAAGGP